MSMGISKRECDRVLPGDSIHNGSHIRKPAFTPESPNKNETITNKITTTNKTNKSTNDDASVLSQVKRKKRRNKSKNKGKVKSGETDPDRLTENINGSSIDRNNGVNESDGVKLDISAGPTTLGAPYLKPLEILHAPTTPYTKTYPLSPRKQALMRYKKSDEMINDRSYIAEVKENLKTKPKANSPGENGKHDVERLLEPTFIQSNMDEKVTLFKFKSSKILVYDEQLSESNTSSGTLLGHGAFEIFQLHNGDVTYLSCGPSFIYPLLPKLKILRIGFNQFILPLVNPERYWKIFIDSEEPNVIEVLGSTFERIVKYRNLFFGSKVDVDKELGLCIDHQDSINEKPHELKSLSIIDETESNDGAISGATSGAISAGIPAAISDGISGFEFTVLAGEIPESPPSAPISPHHENLANIHLDISPIKNHFDPGWTLGKKVSMQSISTNMACLDVNEAPTSSNPLPQFRKEVKTIQHPKPKRPFNSNPFQAPQVTEIDNKSDSSMDSLLDEYEENITFSKSMTFSRSRPPSRQHSVTSTSFLKAPQYSREPYFKGNIEKDEKSQYDELEDFPSTSLSEYNRVHNSHIGGLTRSRRSSKSELYTSESNWMEPSLVANNKRLPKSRSNYSINSRPHNIDLNNTYHNIYKSITQRNLKQYLEDDDLSVKSQRLPTISANTQLDFSNLHSHNGERSKISARASSVRSSYTPTSSKDKTRLLDTKLNSSDVYQLISTRKSRSNIHDLREAKQPTPAVNKPGLASRLFGW